jgi:hypothetical protein
MTLVSIKDSLTRLKDETSLLMTQTPDKHFGACDALTARYNELLNQAKTLFPNEAQITKMQELAVGNLTRINPLDIPKVEKQLQETKLRILELIDNLSKVK